MRAHDAAHIGENHPWATYPVDQIKTKPALAENRQRFFFAQIQKGGDLM